LDLSKPSAQRRRSERVSQSLPLTVRGSDLLGQPFEEPTSTLSFNLHGCRYTSKHHLPKNTWVTLTVKHGSDCRDSRARVAWVQRPHSVREFFQVAVEFEKPVNFWAFEPPPSDWAVVENVCEPGADAVLSDARLAEPGIFEVHSQNTSSNLKEKSMDDSSAKGPVSESFSSGSAVLGSLAPDSNAESLPSEHVAPDNPLLRELGAELERRAKQAVDEAAARASEQVQKAAEDVQRKHLWASEESFRRWKEEFEQAQSAAREQFATRQNEVLGRIRSEFDEGLSQARRLIEEIEKNRNALRAENDAAAEAASRMAQARLEFEALEATRGVQNRVSPSMQEFSDETIARWRERLEAEMNAAQSQWNELLESSLDSGIQRIAAQLSSKSEDFLQESEPAISHRFSQLSRPLLESLTQAREAASEVKVALHEELARAKASLAEIEQATARLNNFSTHIDTAAHDALDELNRRLQAILDAQTHALDERAEALTAAVVEKAASSLEALRQRTADSAAADVKAKLAPHLERVPQILHELSSREAQMAESLRLHRERLRQLSEKNEKELVAYLSAAVEVARDDFEVTRKEAIAKWNEGVEASGARAAHAAAESIDQAAHWSEQDARARLQTLLEQTVAAAGTSLDASVSAAKQKLTGQLEVESAVHAGNIQQQLDAFATGLTKRSRTQIEQAAEVTATGFGEVLRRASDQEIEHLTAATLSMVQGRLQELENSAAQLLRHFEANAESALANLSARMASQLETSIEEGRSAFASEFDALRAAHRSEQDAYQKAWADNLERLSNEAAARHQERLDTASDSWVVSSVRRLNEHGQNAIELLTRSSDQALRDSCAKFFDGLAELFGGREAESEGRDHVHAVAQEAAEAAPPRDSLNQD
jgi:hypothetical protein